MATPFTIPVTAAQVGTYFVGQYYQVLQYQPDYVHQFYSESSTLLRVDGNSREAASGMMKIHTVVTSLGYSGVEIKTAHSLESWNGGVLVMISGSVHFKNFAGRRNFVQSFFLAPQEKGYFVLNDIFQFIDDDQVHQHAAVLFDHATLDSKLSAPTTIPEPAANYMMSGETHTGDYVVPDVNGNGSVNNYGYAEPRLLQVVKTENILDDPAAELSNGSFQSGVNAVQDHLRTSVEESIEEPQKHTYASILRIAKEQPAPSVAPQQSVNKSAPQNSDWNDYSQPIASSNAAEMPLVEAVEEVPSIDDEVEIKSVYVRNLPPNVDPSEVEEEFARFGKLKQTEGVAIRSRKDVGVCYAFVEFEDMSGVRNAVQVVDVLEMINFSISAGSVQIAGRQVYIEERRPNSNIPSRMGRGRGRGRGRSSYQSDASTGRFVSRGLGKAGFDGGDQDYNRPGGNGFYRPGGRQDRANSSFQSSRNGQYSSGY